MSTRILIVGATGTVGAEVARATRARGAEVRALVRSTTSPLPAGVQRVVGDLEDPRSLTAALDGVERAFFVSPHHAREEAMGRSFLDAAEAADVQRLVFSGAYHPDSPGRLASAFLRWVTGLIGPHYRPKLRLEARVRGLAEGVVLMPTNFYQNDDLYRPELLDGIYPQAIGARQVNAVDVRDVADAATRALLDPTVEAGAYPLVGPDSPSGTERASLWATALGREVRYAGDDVDVWETRVGERMDPAKRGDFKKTLGVIQRFGIRVSQRDLEATHRILGHAPRKFADYARERAAEWLAGLGSPQATGT